MVPLKEWLPALNNCLAPIIDCLALTIDYCQASKADCPSLNVILGGYYR